MTDDVTRMLDSYAIRDLAQRYAVAVSFADVDAIAELFDPAVDNGAFGAGRDGTRAFYENFFANRKQRTFLQVGTHQVDLISDDIASGVCFTRSWSGAPGEGWSDIMVCYFDTYRKTDGRWGFLHRRETIHAVMGRRTDEVAIGGPPTEGQALTNRSGNPRAWEYWPRWKEKVASGQLGVRPS